MESQIKDMKFNAGVLIDNLQQEIRDLEELIDETQESDNLDIIAYLLDTTEEKAQQICEISGTSEVSIYTAIKRILPNHQI